jgi:hypothetical protein
MGINKKIKTAFCFSGEFRSIDKTYQTLKEKIFCNFSDYDIFCHTWSDDPDMHKLHFIENDNNTKDILIENRKTFLEKEIFEKNKRNEVNVQGMLRQLYCLKKCNELKTLYEKQNNFLYDIVIRIRPDSYIINNTILEKNAETWDMENYVYTTDHDDHHGYNDRFYFSNSENMDFLSNRLDLLDEYCDKGGIFHYETFFKYCVGQKNLKVCRSSMQFALLRPDGNMSSELI